MSDEIPPEPFEKEKKLLYEAIAKYNNKLNRIDSRLIDASVALKNTDHSEMDWDEIDVLIKKLQADERSSGLLLEELNHCIKEVHYFRNNIVDKINGMNRLRISILNKARDMEDIFSEVVVEEDAQSVYKSIFHSYMKLIRKIQSKKLTYFKVGKFRKD